YGDGVAQGGKGGVKACAATGSTRLPAAPEIPTVDEAGVPGLHVSVWSGIWAPKGTPKPILIKLNNAVAHALADPKVKERLADLGQEIPTRELQTLEGFAAFQKAEIDKWWPIIKAANLKAESIRANAQGGSREEHRMTYQTIDVRKLTPHIGGEIFGVDLSRPFGNQQFNEVHDALMDRLVIFFRDQKLSVEQHK